jgi:polar amino acid transport system substrate-binding protein
VLLWGIRKEVQIRYKCGTNVASWLQVFGFALILPDGIFRSFLAGMRKFLFVLSGFILAIGLSGAMSEVHAQSQVKLFLPENLDSNGNQIPPDNHLLEILSYFERTANIKFEKLILPWKRAQLEALQGNGIVFGLSPTPERLKLYQYSQAVTKQTVWGITYGKPKPSIKSLEDLRGKIVNIGRGYSHGSTFEQARNVVFTVQEDGLFNSARLNKLISKSNDLILWPVRQFKEAREVEKYVNQLFNDYSGAKGVHFEVSDQPIFYDTEHFATKKGEYEEIIAKLDRALKEGNKNGALAKLIKAYR